MYQERPNYRLESFIRQNDNTHSNELYLMRLHSLGLEVTRGTTNDSDRTPSSISIGNTSSLIPPWSTPDDSLVCEETCDQEEEEKETVSFHNGVHYNMEVESDCTKVHSVLSQSSPQASDSKRSKKTQLGLQSELDFLHAHFPSENRGHETDDRTKQSCIEVVDRTTGHEDITVDGTKQFCIEVVDHTTGHEDITVDGTKQFCIEVVNSTSGHEDRTFDGTKFCNEPVDHTTDHEDRTEQTHVESTKTDASSSECLSVEQFYSSKNKRTS